MYQDYLKYWKRILFVVVALSFVFQVNSENELYLLIVFFLAGVNIMVYMNFPRGIHKAVLDEDIDAVIKHLDNGADVDLEGHEEATPLMLSASL